METNHKSDNVEHVEARKDNTVDKRHKTSYEQKKRQNLQHVHQRGMIEKHQYMGVI